MSADNKLRVMLADVSNDFTYVGIEQSHNMIHPPLALLILSSYAKSVYPDDRVDVKVVDVAVTPGHFDGMMDIVREYKPHIFGVRALSHTNQQFDKAARLVKEFDPNIVTIGGGPFANASPDLVMNNPDYDVVCLAEGEYPLRDIIAVMLVGGGLQQFYCVKGIHYRHNGVVCKNEPCDPITDLDSLPFPDYGQIDINVYSTKHSHTSVLRPYAVILASRGCPFSCVYCHVIFGKRARLRSAENVAREVAQLHERFGIRDFLITDDIFNVNLKHAKETLRAINSLGIEDQRIFFPNGLRGDIMDDEFLDILVESGVAEVVYAVESASPRIQKMIQKRLNIPKVENTIMETAKRGIVVNAFFMAGFPGETLEELDMTTDMIIRLLEYIHFPYIGIVRAFHGSGLYKIAQGLGYDEEFLMKHAMLPHGNNEMIFPEYNFLPKEALESMRKMVSYRFGSRERMERMLKIQRKVFTEEELVRKYATYFGSDVESARRFLSVYDRKMKTA